MGFAPAGASVFIGMVKSEVRRPKSERNPKFQIRGLGTRRFCSFYAFQLRTVIDLSRCIVDFRLRPSDFGFLSDFGIGISDFLLLLPYRFPLPRRLDNWGCSRSY